MLRSDPWYRGLVVGKQGRTVSQELPFSARQEAVLEALGDPTRRRILGRLRDGPLAVVAIAAGLPVSRPAVSQHLRVLKEAGLVIDRPEANRRLYSIDPRGLAELRAALDSFWAVALRQYKDVVEKPSPPA